MVQMHEVKGKKVNVRHVGKQLGGDCGPIIHNLAVILDQSFGISWQLFSLLYRLLNYLRSTKYLISKYACGASAGSWREMADAIRRMYVSHGRGPNFKSFNGLWKPDEAI